MEIFPSQPGYASDNRLNLFAVSSFSSMLTQLSSPQNRLNKEEPLALRQPA
jgi:hypothetical protein